MIRSLSLLFIILPALVGQAFAAVPVYPDLRDSHAPALQAELDAALIKGIPNFMDGVTKKEISIVVADVTDLEHPKVAWYNPGLMLYAAGMPKIAIALGALLEIDLGNLKLDDELHRQLVNMIKRSSNRDATAVLDKVGIKRLSEILQNERYGKLYDPAHGGGLWVGKPYSKGASVQKDPLHNLSHGSSAMQAARFYYGVMNGTILDHKHLPLLREMFGKPGIKHTTSRGCRKPMTWKFSTNPVPGGTSIQTVVYSSEKNLKYIAVSIDQHPKAGHAMTTGIQIVDKLMLKRVAQPKQD